MANVLKIVQPMLGDNLETAHKKAKIRLQKANDHLWAIRKGAALKIDPKTAEVKSDPDEFDATLNGYCARASNSEIWIPFWCFSDEICETLWQKYLSEQPVATGPFARDEDDLVPF